jgi:enoyl-[acyl-carrier protein] reductase I
MNRAQPFEGKRALVFGLANERSIAWGITRALQEQGCRDFAFTFAGEAFEKRMRPLAESVAARLILPCDVGDDGQIDRVFEEVGRIWDGLDVLVHSRARRNPCSPPARAPSSRSPITARRRSFPITT